MEDVDLIQWDLEVSGRPGGRQFQLPTLPALGQWAIKVRRPGQERSAQAASQGYR